MKGWCKRCEAKFEKNSKFSKLCDDCGRKAWDLRAENNRKRSYKQYEIETFIY